MATKKSILSFEEMLLVFTDETDSMLSMLEWLCSKMMKAEIDSRVGASKSERSDKRLAYRSGYRPRGFDTRMRTMDRLQ